MKQYYVGLLCQASDIAQKEYFYFENNNDTRVYGCDTETILLNGVFNKENNTRDEDEVIQSEMEHLLIDKFRKNELHFDLIKNSRMKPVRIIYEIVKYKNYLFAKELYTGKLFPIVNSHFIIQPVDSYRRNVLYFSLIKNSNIMIFPKIIVINSGIASKNVVIDYQNKYKLFSRKKYIKKIEKLFNENIFREEIIENEPIIKDKQNSITIIMENIEYLIEQVNDLKEKEKFKEKYKEILKSSFLTTKLLSIGTLVALETEIEIYLNFNKQNNDGLDNYLENIKKEYLLNLIENNGKKTNLTIEELDKIMELFLKTKNNYSVITQRKILKTISLLYLFEVMENKDIDIRILENGYFKDNIKSIILGIKSLQELGILENNLNLYLDSDISIINVVNVIKELKVKKIDLDETKELIKII